MDETLHLSKPADLRSGTDGAGRAESLLAGDTVNTQEFDALWHQYYARLVYFFERHSFHREEAEELAQDTFFRAYRSNTDLSALDSQAAWLYTIARNVLKNHLRFWQAIRRNAPKVSLDSANSGEAEMEIPYEAQQHRTVEARDRVERVNRCVAGLPPRMRQTFQLHFIQGLAYSQIALAMQVSVQAVKSQIHQARSRLAECLEASADPLSEEGRDER